MENPPWHALEERLFSMGIRSYVYVKYPLEEYEKRDPKGLYKKARNGEITNMTGLTAPYEEPETPELIIDTNLTPLNQCVAQLTQFLIVNKIIFSRHRLFNQ